MASPHTAAVAPSPGPAHDNQAMSVEQRLENADKLTTMTEAKLEEHHAEPRALGMAPEAWVALAMLVLLAVLLWKRVPRLVAGILDGQIEAIRKQLDEARALRAEAEALRGEYAARIAGAEKDAAAMLDHARHEADAIVAKAEADTGDLIARREKMATDKIEAAERTALVELRAKAASAATAAAGQLIAAHLSPERDRALVDGAIADLARH
jgi:F-type H+-transporting ATPase subunit b